MVWCWGCFYVGRSGVIRCFWHHPWHLVHGACLFHCYASLSRPWLSACGASGSPLVRHVLDCTLEVDGVAACWPLKRDIGSDGCRIDVLEADGTCLRLCRSCCCPLCCPVGWRLVGQVHLDWRACHSSTPYIWPGRLTAGVLLESWIPNVKTAHHKRNRLNRIQKTRWWTSEKKPVQGRCVTTN